MKRTTTVLIASLLIFAGTIAQTTFKEQKVGHIFYVSLPDYMTKTTGQNDDALIQFKRPSGNPRLAWAGHVPGGFFHVFKVAHVGLAADHAGPDCRYRGVLSPSNRRHAVQIVAGHLGGCYRLPA